MTTLLLSPNTFLGHERVTRVNYPGLPDSPYSENVKRYLQDGKAAGILSFDIIGGKEAGTKFIDA